MKNQLFGEAERAAIYRVIAERRDVRTHFVSTSLPEDVLTRILLAAHQAPSVGLMQPWDFILIRNEAQRRHIQQHVVESARRADIYTGRQQALYHDLKLEGILDAPLNIAVTCDADRQQGSGLGRQTNPATPLYSTVCAIQNLWLAARAESVGVGWVSILEECVVKQALRIPDSVQLVAYLCVGYVATFDDMPALENSGWETRSPLSDRLHLETWNSSATSQRNG